MDVAIIGSGYVGVVTAACLASHGHRVTCVDIDPDRVARISAGEAPMHEPGLPALLAEAVAARRLSATTDLAAAVAGAEVTFICVGTPSQDGAIDLSLVETAAGQIGAALGSGEERYRVVVVKSTVVPGTTAGPVRRLLQEGSGLPADRLGLCMNPEFLSQGSAVRDFLEPDRIVIGAMDDASAAVLERLYAGFACPKLRVSLTNAELIKYAANSFQACLISFSNQIAAICEATPGADEAEVMAAVHLDRLIAVDGRPAPVARFLRGGIGFGGSCFPKDLVALRHFGRSRGAATTMLDAIVDTNHDRPRQVMELLRRQLGDLTGRRIAVLGLAFKPDTDDLRESPGVALLRLLAEAGAEAHGHDPLPEALANARRLLRNGIALHDSVDEALEGAEAALIATAWPAYRRLDWTRLGAGMARPVLLDGRGLLADMEMSPGLGYRRIGVG